MKTLLASILIASTVTLAVPSPAAAIGIHVGPRGVGVRLGHPHRYWHHRHWHRRWHHRHWRRY